MKLQLPHIYLVNTALLAAHQVDSGVQHEWQLFGLPGDEQSFVLSSFVLFLIVLFGFLKVKEESVAGFAFSLNLALTGTLSFVLHQYQVSQGQPEYTAFLSRVILWTCLLVSITQGWMTLRALLLGLRSERGPRSA